MHKKPINHAPVTFRLHSAEAKVTKLVTGVVEVIYSGPMTYAVSKALRALVIEATPNAPCLVLRLDRALTLYEVIPPDATDVYRLSRAPAAMVVRQNQYDVWSDYARAIERLGVMRAVFLDSEVEQAYQWAAYEVHAATL